MKKAEAHESRDFTPKALGKANSKYEIRNTNDEQRMTDNDLQLTNNAASPQRRWNVRKLLTQFAESQKRANGLPAEVSGSDGVGNIWGDGKIGNNTAHT